MLGGPCCQTAITLFLQWNKRIDGVFERSKTLVPVHQRTKKLDYAVPAKALCSYKTKEVGNIYVDYCSSLKRQYL